MEKLKQKRIMLFALIGVLFLTVVGTTYAYFNLTTSGNDNASGVTIYDAKLHLTYDGGERITGTTIEPSNTTPIGTKTIEVTNDGTESVYYLLHWKELYNELVRQNSSSEDELYITATCTSYTNYGESNQAVSGTCEGFTKDIPTQSTLYTYSSGEVSDTYAIKENISISSGITHVYSLSIYFRNESYSQNYNQNKQFYGSIGVAESTIGGYTLTLNAGDGTLSETTGWTGSGTTATKTIAIGDTYGTLPTPIRSGYGFTGWYTASSNGTKITGTETMSQDTIIYAQWFDLSLVSVSPKSSLSTYTWSEIKTLSTALVSGTLNENLLSSVYNISIGDVTAAVSITPSGKETESHTFRLVGINHDVDASGNTLGMTFEQTDVTSLASGVMQAEAVNNRWGWEVSDLKSEIDNVTVQSDLASVITEAKKTSILLNKTYNRSDYLWIMSETEIAGTQTNTRLNKVEGTQYAYYYRECGVGTTNAVIDIDGDDVICPERYQRTFWLRSLSSITSPAEFAYNSRYYITHIFSIDSAPVALCFCI